MQRLLLTLLLLAAAPLAQAQVLEIRPALVDSSEPVETALSEKEGRASTSIEGAGGTLRIDYVASEPIEVYMVPLGSDGRFVPTDFLRFILPQTDEGTVEIDLTVSPGWSPGNKRWLLHLLTEHQDAEAGFADIRILPASPLKVVTAAIGHFFAKEPYTPSSYHALRGYRTFGIPVPMILGALLVCAALASFFIAKKKLTAVILTVLAFQAFYGLRAGLDFLRYTGEHLTEYAAGTYDEAGSIHTVAAALRETAEASDSLYVCRDGTNYKEKLLRYFAYPIKISAEAGITQGAEYALVMNKSGDWEVETRTEEGRTVQTLRCNDIERDAQLLTRFEDGSSLFRLLP